MSLRAKGIGSDESTIGALSSIVFASAALEAFINERSEWAAQMCNFVSQTNIVVTFSNVMADAERSRSSVPAKYQLARWILCGQAYDQGINPYQDFSLLIDLRNSLLHLKPRPSIIKRFSGKNILIVSDDDAAIESLIGGWTIRIQTKEMAMWAARSAIAFIAEFLDAVSSNAEIHSIIPSKLEYFGPDLTLLKF